MTGLMVHRYLVQLVHICTQWYTWYIVTDNGTQCYTSVHHVTHPKGFQGGTLYGLKGL